VVVEKAGQAPVAVVLLMPKCAAISSNDGDCLAIGEEIKPGTNTPLDN
jgi:hypothetical protein